jgi:hypothetical protein
LKSGRSPTAQKRELRIQTAALPSGPVPGAEGPDLHITIPALNRRRCRCCCQDLQNSMQDSDDESSATIQLEWHPSQCETNDAKHPHIAPPGQEGQDPTMNTMPRSIQNGSRRGGGSTSEKICVDVAPTTPSALAAVASRLLIPERSMPLLARRGDMRMLRAIPSPPVWQQ